MNKPFNIVCKPFNFRRTFTVVADEAVGVPLSVLYGQNTPLHNRVIAAWALGAEEDTVARLAEVLPLLREQRLAK